MNKCCSNCFNDKLIIEYIEKESINTGDCQFCNSTNVKLVDTDNLIDTFEILLELYEESKNENSVELNILMQKDWEIFFDYAIAKKLLPKIIAYSLDKKYIHKNINYFSIQEIWNSFRTEIKHTNRFFPKYDNFKVDDLRAWVNELKNDQFRKKIFYRARISDNKQLIPTEAMGKPPTNIASSGRVNPIGISYLYLATDYRTAISEVRPHKGDMLTIAKVKITKKLNLADLRNPRKNISPFSRPEASAEQLFKYISLLQHLGEELSKPVLPREAHLEYLPSQYLSELIKDAGFDGIIYKSSVGNGDNLVLFEDINVQFQTVGLYEVKNLSFKSEKIIEY